MDTSETYISMQRAAYKHIPKPCPKQGDFVCNLSAIGGPFTFVNYLEQKNPSSPEWTLCCQDYDRDFLVPLLRQDQLQELLDGSFMEKLAGFWDAVSSGRLSFDTWEQAWLSQVMRVKYHKTWVGGHWFKFDVEG